MSFSVLMYHRIEGNDRYSISRDVFSRQMSFLQQQGYRAIVPGDLENRDATGGRCVMITFDDGFASDWEIALPVLRHCGFRGVSFVTTGFIGQPGYMDWSQVKALGDAGFAIESHSHSHVLLDTMNTAALNRDLVVSRLMLEQHTGRPVTCLALPGGGWRKGMRDAVVRAGYRKIFTSLPGTNRSAADAFMYRRTLITGATSMVRFNAIVCGDRAVGLQMRYAYHIRQAVKRMIGSERYHALWCKYYKNAEIDRPEQ